MDRRMFIQNAGAVVLTSGALLRAPAVHAQPRYTWKMVTMWPKDFPGVGTGANYLARTIEAMSGKRITITVYGAGELVPPFDSFDAVANGTAELGHAGSVFWQEKHTAMPFFNAVPFGLNTHEMMAWLTFGGGQALWDELYAPFNLKPFPAGSSGTQMAGWFNKEINSIEDFKGLKMRVAGLGRNVLDRVGAQTLLLPPDQIVPALLAGDIQAGEFVGPYNDLPLGFHQAAKYYYWPGWQEPGAVAECFMNKKIYDALPADLQAIIQHATRDAYSFMLSEYTTHNAAALVDLITKHQVRLKRLPDRVLLQLGRVSQEVVADVAAGDPFTQKVYASYTAFRRQAVGWSQVGEEGYSLARTLAFL